MGQEIHEKMGDWTRAQARMRALVMASPRRRRRVGSMRVGVRSKHRKKGERELNISKVRSGVVLLVVVVRFVVFIVVGVAFCCNFVVLSCLGPSF